MDNLETKLWSILDVAKGLRCYAPEMATLFFLKFTSQNAERLGILISKLNSFEALVELYLNDTINQLEFLHHISEIVDKANMNRYGIAEHFSQFISTSTDERAIKQLLYMVRDLDFVDNPEDCKVANMFTWYLSKDTGWDNQNKTAISNAELMANLAVTDNTKTIYDGFCGYGISLSAAMKKAPYARVFGQDINPNCVMISAIMQWLHFRNDFSLVTGNTVRSPLPAQGDYLQRFDSVIIDPPFGLRFEDEDIEILPDDLLAYKHLTQRRGDWFFIQHALSVLKENGIAAIQVTMGTLFATGKALEIRKTAIQRGHIKAVIELPSGMVPGSSIPVSMLVLGNANSFGDVILVNAASKKAEHFFKRLGKTKCELTPEGIQEITNMVNNRITVDGISRIVSHEELAEKNYILTPSAYLTVAENTYSYSPIEDITSEMSRLETELAEINNALAKALEAICE